ncbi:MAG TPA: hypothetical protein VIF02_13995 [Methylocella sp.]|jgi:hypothetical protein
MNTIVRKISPFWRKDRARQNSAAAVTLPEKIKFRRARGLVGAAPPEGGITPKIDAPALSIGAVQHHRHGRA